MHMIKNSSFKLEGSLASHYITLQTYYLLNCAWILFFEKDRNTAASFYVHKQINIRFYETGITSHENLTLG